MHSKMTQMKRWFASVMAIMLVVTGLLPIGAVQAAAGDNWTAISHPAAFLVDSTADQARFGTYGNPVKTLSRTVSGIQLTYKDATKNDSEIDLTVGGSTIATTVKIAGSTLTLPAITIAAAGTPTKVTVRPKGSSVAEDLKEFYLQFTPASSNKLVFEPTPPASNTYDNPIDSPQRTLTGLQARYNNATLDPNPSIEVRVNGVAVRTITSGANSNGTAFSLGDIDLPIGTAAIQIYATNTGEHSVVYYRYGSADSPVTVEGFNGGLDAFNPVLYGDPKITLSGTFGAGVIGSNLRLKITTNNGQTVEDLSNTAPTVSGNTYTFHDITLKPGMNKISFYERVGSVTREHIHFYVQYNNTPLITDLKIGDQLLNDPNITTSPTYITVPSERRLTLNLSGMAKNADNIEVVNVTTGDRVATSVGRTGNFAINLPSQLGENTLHIRALNANKEVGIITRNIVVVTTAQGSADQFYKASIDNVSLRPNQLVQYPGDGDPNTGQVSLTGTALLRYVDITDEQVFDRFRMHVKEIGGPFEDVYDLTLNNGYEIQGSPQSGFTEYLIDATIPAGTLEHNKRYQVTLTYQYFTKDSDGNLTSPSGYYTINNYQYEFQYVNKNLPRFGTVYIKGTNVPLNGGVNTIATSPLNLVVNAFNMPTATPNLSDIAIEYNGIALTNGTDYELDNAQQVNAGENHGSFDLELKKLPAGQGKLKIKYTGGNPTEVEYILNIQITPFVQLTYVDSTGQVRSFEDGYQINSDKDIYNLDGKVYNYVLNAGNISATLNGNSLNITSIADGKFKILADNNIKTHLRKGNNTLKVVLEEEPKVTFTYNISYITAKAPTIDNVTLYINQNDKDVELTKRASDTAYQTGAHFLTSFAFEVTDATHVYVEKSGKRIIDFRYKDGDWELDDSNQEYVKARNEASLNDDLEDIFDRRNFDSRSRSKFEARMSSSQYGDLLEEVQDAVTDINDQDQHLALFPLTLRKDADTVYTIVAEDENGTVVRYNLTIRQQSNSWEIISPVKAKETDPYIIVNSNSALIKIFAENASSIMFGKTEARTTNTTKRDFYYDDDLGRSVPETYYVFTATVPLKKGLNNIKYTVQVGNNSYNDEIQIYNANTSVDGAEFREVLGKKTTFSPFDKALTLKFPSGTVLLSPTDHRAGEEVRNPSGDIFVDVPLYFGIADRTTGQVNLPGYRMENRLALSNNFNYASPLYYIDAGDIDAPGGRDPYYEEGDADEFADRYDNNLVPSRRGELTIQYDPSIVNAANTQLTIFYHDGRDWLNLGGVVNTSRQTITIPFSGFGYYMVMKTRETFDDVVNHDYARDDLETLFSKGIMVPYSGSSFGANMAITRGEFATMLVKALDLPINAGPYRDSNERDPLEPTFSDVRPNRNSWDWEYKYIETAARAGIVRGKQPGYFRPDDPLTREEAAVMIARAMNMKMTGTLEAAQDNLGKSFTDAKDVSYYAAQSILAVTKAKIMLGSPVDSTDKKTAYRFLPQNNLTRAEMAVITVRVMKQLKKLPK